MNIEEIINRPVIESHYSEIPYESEALKDMENGAFTSFLKNYPEEEHASIEEKLAYIRDYNLHFAYCDDFGPFLHLDHEYYYKNREKILHDIGFSEKKFYAFELLQEQIRILKLNPISTFDFITYLYFHTLKDRNKKSTTYAEKISEILNLIDSKDAEMTIKVGRKKFSFENKLFIKSMLMHYKEANLQALYMAKSQKKEQKRETDYRIIKTLLDYLPIDRTNKRGNYTQAERNFSLCVLYFYGSLLGDEYEVCLNNNATFDKLMRDFKDTEDTHIGSSLF